MNLPIIDPTVRIKMTYNCLIDIQYDMNSLNMHLLASLYSQFQKWATLLSGILWNKKNFWWFCQIHYWNSITYVWWISTNSVGEFLNVPADEYEPLLVNEHSTKIEIFLS